MNIKVLLFKDSNCDLCKLMQKEITDNPPNADVHIYHIKHHNNKLVEYYDVKVFPTTIIIEEGIGNEINRFEGFVDTKSIDVNIKEYETKYVV